MRTIFAEYNPGRNSIDVYTSADYMLRIDCWEAEKNLRTTPGLDCALNTLDIIVMFKKRGCLLTQYSAGVKMNRYDILL